VTRWIPRVGAVAGFAVGLAVPLVAAWYLKSVGAIGAVGTLAVAVTGVIVSRWLGPAHTSIRFALIAMLLLLAFRWLGL
jgi:hypothetical protein